MPTLHPLPPELAADLQLAAGWASFGARLQAISQALAALPKSTRFDIRGEVSNRFIGTVALADFARKFEGIGWTLTGDSFGNGGVGEVRTVWKNPKKRKGWLRADQKTNAANFRIYASHPQESGLIFLALHETAHVTELGLATGAQCWTMYLESGGAKADYPASEQWRFNEQVANSIVRALCRRLSYPELQNPGAGYVQDVV